MASKNPKSVPTTKTLPLTCQHKDAWGAHGRARCRKSKIFVQKQVGKSSRAAERRRKPSEKNKTTGRRRVVLFFLLTAVPPAEASGLGTLTLLRAAHRPPGALYATDIMQGEASDWSEPQGILGGMDTLYKSLQQLLLGNQEISSREISFIRIN